MQRGSDNQDIFFSDEDRQVYLELLAEQADCFGLKVSAYCLMSDHVHLVATPRKADSLAKAIGLTHLLYARHINRIYDLPDALWQGRFASCALDRPHSRTAAIYVERSPVRASLVRLPWRYKWSSAKAHCTGKDTSGMLDLEAWAKMVPDGQPGTWPEALKSPIDEDMQRKIRIWTSRGRPLGTDRFIAGLETKLGRRLHPLAVGRPKLERPAAAKKTSRNKKATKKKKTSPKRK